MLYRDKIKQLEKKYSETNVAKDEIVSPITRKQINKTYYDNQQKRRVDGILNDVKNRNSIKVEVHNIVQNVNLKEVCSICKEEVTIAAIIIYCLKTRDSQFRPDRSKIWKKYGITWQRYALIVTQLLRIERENSKIPIVETDLGWKETWD